MVFFEEIVIVQSPFLGPFECPWCGAYYGDFNTTAGYAHHVNTKQCVAVAVYCDGGVIGRNPSEVGGTWAWCTVNAAGEVLERDSGVIEGLCTNNVSEFVAAVRALEHLPNKWRGQLCSDSAVTLGRLCAGWALQNLPPEWIERGARQLKRLGPLRPVLLQGHPTKEELAEGVGKRNGYPVSVHNVWCDEECGRQAVKYREGLAAKAKGEHAA